MKKTILPATALKTILPAMALKTILLATVLAPTCIRAQTGNYTITGKINPETAKGKVYLAYRSAGKRVLDSTAVTDGAFKFTGPLSEPIMAQMLLDHNGSGLARIGQQPDILNLYIEDGEVKVTATDSIKTAVITGSKLNEENKTLKDQLSVVEKEMQEKKRAIYLSQIKKHPDSYISLEAVIEIAGSKIDPLSIRPLFDGLSARIQKTNRGQEFARQLEAVNATTIGAMAPVFTQNDVNDKPVSLSDFRGKYILLDFWASWCVPCRKENPNVVKAYQQYKDKNFTVVGVSLDQPGKKDAWMEAIKTDGLAWTQVSDLKFWDNAVAQQYGIKAIPQNYLIDPTGMIIAANLRGEDLQKKLESLLK